VACVALMLENNAIAAKIRPRIRLNEIERVFILGFGVFHFLVPVFIPPNFLTAIVPIYSLFWGLRLADLVIPGCIVLASLSIVFIYTKNFWPMAILIFLYLGGAFFHSLYLLGFLPPLLVVPDQSYLAFGIFIDTVTSAVIYDYFRRVR
jgi:hypothetical protein